MPVLVLALLVVVLPLGRAFYYSMTAFNGLEAPHFVGLQNYAAVLQNPLTLPSALNTLWIFMIA